MFIEIDKMGDLEVYIDTSHVARVTAAHLHNNATLYTFYSVHNVSLGTFTVHANDPEGLELIGIILSNGKLE